MKKYLPYLLITTITLVLIAVVACAPNARNNPMDPGGTAYVPVTNTTTNATNTTNTNTTNAALEPPYVLGLSLPEVNKPARVQISWPVRTGVLSVDVFYTNENLTNGATSLQTFIGSSTTQAVVTVMPLSKTNNFFVKYNFSTSNVVVSSNTVPGWKTYASTLGFSANQVDISIRGHKPYVALSSGTTVNVYDGSSGSWLQVGSSVPSTNTVTALSLASGGAAGDLPYVTYTALDNPAAPARSFKYSGSWSELTGLVATAGSNILYYNPVDSQMYIMYRDTSIMNNLDVRKDASGAGLWVSTGGTFAASVAMGGTSVGLAAESPGGNLYTTFMAGGEVGAIWFYNGTWAQYWSGNNYGSGTMSVRSTMHRIASDSTGKWVACISRGAGSRFIELFSVAGGSWNGGFATSAEVPKDAEMDLRLSKGTPVVCYRGNSFGLPTLWKYQGAAWSSVGPATGFGTSVGNHMRMNVDDDGVPYVVYESGTVKVMRYEPF